MEYESLKQEGFISKTVTVEQENDGLFRMIIQVRPVGKEPYQEILLFNRKKNF
ncbi:hypothetical protein [Enterococcus gilvus]|uniref:hypothetical protein n=1 Tax=Enterococcus gilvus TaxID=160453 RepID=UPI001C8C74E3|nr:hypothetical protein [Enterococcus gilvus]MBX8938497.1 hypothetical protein [Enterococcus gilvus]